MSAYEAEVYVALVRGGRQTMAEVARASDVPKQRVYDIVEKLRDGGFVEVLDEYPQEAYAIPPSEAIDPLKRRIERTEQRLEELHAAVDEVKGGVAMFKNDATIEKYVRRLLREAEVDRCVVLPHDRVEEFRDVLSAPGGPHTRVVVSDVPERVVEDGDAGLEDVADLGDEVRGIKSAEAMVVTADRERGMFWTGHADTRITDASQGFYVLNSELAFLFDRFLTDSLWPRARLIARSESVQSPPATYVRMGDCIDDVAALRDGGGDGDGDLYVAVEGYEVSSRDRARVRGRLVDYHDPADDIRAYLVLDVSDPGEPAERVTVGGWKATMEDYEARRLTVYGSRDACVGDA